MQERASRSASIAGNTNEQPIRVLFLCTANSARSQLAEALLLQKGRGRFIVASAGTKPGRQVRPEVVQLLSAMGIDWSQRKPKSLEVVIDQPWDLVITLCDRLKESCVTLPNRPVYIHWGIPDPAGVTDSLRRESAFKEALALIAWRLDLMLALRDESFGKLVAEEQQRVAGPQSTAPHGTRSLEL